MKNPWFTSDNVHIFLAVTDANRSQPPHSASQVPSAVEAIASQAWPCFDPQRRLQPTAACAGPQARQLAAQLRQLQAHALDLTRAPETGWPLPSRPNFDRALGGTTLAALATTTRCWR